MNTRKQRLRVFSQAFVTDYYNVLFPISYPQFFQTRGYKNRASNLGYLAPNPGQFFMGAKLSLGPPECETKFSSK